MDNLNPISTMVVGSSSSLSFPSPNWIHHIFPSFHGPDVRKAFLSHILQSFKNNGIKPFIDKDIERSKSIGPELKEAIKGSRIAIVLLSKNYASSSWCLDELVEIMKCRDELGQIVMTVFYDVPPTDIRKQTGKCGKAFKKVCEGKTKEHIERWRKALEDVAQIAGEHSFNWDNEAAMIEKLTNEVSDKLRNFTLPKDLEDLVGINSHMEEIKPLLCLDLDDVRMIGIWGPPGIGKTTIAKFLFHQLSRRFQLGAIMVNIKFSYPRPCLDEYDARLQLQHQMLSQMINQKEVPNLDLAFNGLSDRKVILVLDEVDHSDQLIALAKEKKWFGPGSRIIITTEDLSVLKAHRIEHIYKVKYPSSEETFKIFCMNAFGKEYPDDGFYELACEATYLAGEFPLGLKVLGAALRGKSKEEWKLEMPTLRNRLDGKIESIIKFSYNALYDDEKDLFLYITCFSNSFVNANQVEVLFAKKFSNIKKSLHVLHEKSFISIHKPHGFIAMHTLLKKFGRETARKEDVHGNKKRRLLVDARDICDDTIDYSKVIGIHLIFEEGNISEEELNELNISEKAVERMSDVQFISIIDDINGCTPYERLHSLLYHSQMIRYLRWDYFQNKSLPATFNPESLVRLYMNYSKLEKLWERNKPLNCLKFMDLSYSKYLKELPDLSTATNLKYLHIRRCSTLKKLPDLLTATNFEFLDIGECSSLKEISDLSTATLLKDLNISGCLSLRKLKKFHQSNNLVSPQLSDSLTFINAKDCTSLEILDCSFTNPDIHLNFTNCFKLNKKARDLIMLTPTSKYAVLPGKHVPTCFNYRATDGGPLKIKLNETSFPTSLRFQACIILGKKHDEYVPDQYMNIYIKVRNKEETRYYSSGYEDIDFEDIDYEGTDDEDIDYEDIVYEDINVMVKNNSRWIETKTEHIYTFEVEVSEVTSTELFFEFETNDSNWKVGECGLLQNLEVPIKGRIGPHTHDSYNVGIIFPLLSTLFSKFWRSIHSCFHAS